MHPSSKADQGQWQCDYFSLCTYGGNHDNCCFYLGISQENDDIAGSIKAWPFIRFLTRMYL